MTTSERKKCGPRKEDYYDIICLIGHENDNILEGTVFDIGKCHLEPRIRLKNDSWTMAFETSAAKAMARNLMDMSTHMVYFTVVQCILCPSNSWRK
jgi:hypothetical protein